MKKDQSEAASVVLPYISRLLAEWQADRQELRRIEESEHPDLTDSYGRIWVWRDKDLYVHDGCLAFTKAMIESGDLGLPTTHLRDNPNYNLCDVCIQDWDMDVTKDVAA